MQLAVGRGKCENRNIRKYYNIGQYISKVFDMYVIEVLSKNFE